MPHSFDHFETFEKRSILFKFKENEDFNHPSTIYRPVPIIPRGPTGQARIHCVFRGLRLYKNTDCRTKKIAIFEIINMQKLSTRITAPPKQNRRNQNLNDSLIVSSCFRKKYLHEAFLTASIFYLNQVVLSI